MYALFSADSEIFFRKKKDQQLSFKRNRGLFREFSFSTKKNYGGGRVGGLLTVLHWLARYFWPSVLPISCSSDQSNGTAEDQAGPTVPSGKLGEWKQKSQAKQTHCLNPL